MLLIQVFLVAAGPLWNALSTGPLLPVGVRFSEGDAIGAFGRVWKELIACIKGDSWILTDAAVEELREGTYLALLKYSSCRLPMKLSTEKLNELIEHAIVDAYGESEQRVAFYTVIKENLALPFVTRILGMDVTVERIDLTKSEEIVAICRRGRSRQPIPILELPLPKRAPIGAEWIEAYRRWSGGN